MALTSFQVKKTLQIASAYGAYKGNELMRLRIEGKNCEAEKTRLKLLYAYIDSIQDYGSIYVNPSAQFGVTAITSGAIVSITINGTITYPALTLNTGVPATANQLIVDFINAQNIGFTAELVDTANLQVKVSAVNGSVFNSKTLVVTTTGVITINNASTTFTATGDDYFSRYTSRCIANNEVQTILDRINSFVDVPCELFVTF